MIRVLATDLRVLPMRARMPFRYGIASLTALPHLLVYAEVAVDGARHVGVAADGLPPKWFTKNPETTFADDLADMVAVIAHACDAAREIGDAASVFDLWHGLYAAQGAWGRERGYPPLLWHFGVSLVERAVLDAFCRAAGTTFAQAARRNTLGVRLDALHPELAGMAPADALPPEPLRAITVRHTVGLTDPLTDDDIPHEERLDDGLPQSLAAGIAAYGLTRFKIKLWGDADRDRERLARLAAMLDASAGDYAFTLDGNEQYADMAAFRAFWETLAADATLAPFLRRLIFVEQPTHRDTALADATRDAFAGWPDRPPVVIDEADGDLAALPLALALGYAGASHKNCKGVVKGLANAALLAARRRADPTGAYIQSGEDLANVGPVALLQDLAAMATLGISHVERNGHHYFAGLGMWPDAVQTDTLRHHGDLYRRHPPPPFPTLDVRGGQIAVGSVVDAPFGVATAPDRRLLAPLPDDETLAGLVGA